MSRKILYINLVISILLFSFSGCRNSRKEPTPVPVTPTAVPTATENPKAFIINPGTGIGRVQVNKSKLISVEEWLGKADSEEVTDEGDVKLTYKTHKLTFFFTTDNQILKTVLVENPEYKTNEGIGVGSNIVDVKTLYDGVLNKTEKVYLAKDETKYYYDSGNVTSILISKKIAPSPSAKPSPKVEPAAVTKPTSSAENPSPQVSPKSSIPEDYISSAKKILDDIEDLEDIAKSIRDYQNYGNHVTETEIKVNKFLKDNPVSYIPRFNEEISSAMTCYRDAKTFWHAVMTAGTYKRFKILTADIFIRHPELLISLKRIYKWNDIYRIVTVKDAGRAGAVMLWEEGNRHVETAERLLDEVDD